jgi:putative ABC transport system substrate-binding protein
MRRRDFIASLFLTAAVPYARAQQPAKTNRIAVVNLSLPIAELMRETERNPGYTALVKELRRLGYVEGHNLVVDRYSGEGRTERYSELAREMVRTKPDLIFTNSTRMARFLKDATSTIPIVALTGAPVAEGIVSNIARPGGNITGASVEAGPEVIAKLLELLMEMVPRASRVGFLVSQLAWQGLYGTTLREAAKRAGITLVGPPLGAVIQEPEYRRVVTAIAQEGADALIVEDSSENHANVELIIELAAQARLPAIYANRKYTQLGGLISHGVDFPELYRHLAGQIVQILKGAAPGEIPYYQPTKYELVINLKSAKTLGLDISPSLLARADEVIE